VGHELSPSAERLLKLAAAAGEDVSDESIGELLLEAVALAGSAGIDPEGALRRRANELLGEAGKL
jgi:hypothetical protein